MSTNPSLPLGSIKLTAYLRSYSFEKYIGKSIESCPILFFTAQKKVFDKIFGFNTGKRHKICKLSTTLLIHKVFFFEFLTPEIKLISLFNSIHIPLLFTLYITDLKKKKILTLFSTHRTFIHIYLHRHTQFLNVN